MMQHFLAPYFYSAVKVLNASEKDGVKPTQKAVVDLETLLTHLQQDTDIPQIELVVDVTIAEAVAKVRPRAGTAAGAGRVVAVVAFYRPPHVSPPGPRPPAPGPLPTPRPRPRGARPRRQTWATWRPMWSSSRVLSAASPAGSARFKR